MKYQGTASVCHHTRIQADWQTASPTKDCPSSDRLSHEQIVHCPLTIHSKKELYLIKDEASKDEMEGGRLLVCSEVPQVIMRSHKMLHTRLAQKLKKIYRQQT